MFERLSADNKTGLIEILPESLRKGRKNREKSFYSSFGAFASGKSAEWIVKEIKAARKFRLSVDNEKKN